MPKFARSEHEFARQTPKFARVLFMSKIRWTYSRAFPAPSVVITLLNYYFTIGALKKYTIICIMCFNRRSDND